MEHSDFGASDGGHSSQKNTFFVFFRFRRYMQALARFWWISVILACIGVFGIRYAAQMKTPVYSSSAKILFKPSVNIPGLTGNDVRFADELYLAISTEVEMLQSRMLQEKTDARLKAEKPTLRIDDISVSVKQSRDSAVILLEASSTNPAALQPYLNTLMDVYIASKKNVEVEMSDATVAAISEQLAQMEKELQKDEDSLVQFRRTNNIVFLEEQGNSASRYLVGLNSDIAKLKTEYQLLEMLDFDKNLAMGNVGIGKPDDKNSTGLGTQMDYLKAQQQIALKKAELEDLSKYLRPVHPKVIALNDEIERQQRTLDILRNLSINQLKSRKESLALQIKGLENTIKEWEQKALIASQGMAEYDRLKSKIDRSKALYNQLLNSMQTIDLSKRFKQDRITVLESASPASARFALRNQPILGALFGIILGLFLIWCIHLLDDRFDSMLELQDWLTEEVYGQIPNVRLKTGQALLLDTEIKDCHALREAYRNLRSALLFIPPADAKPRTVLITSSVPGEGKSSICANLAINLASSGSRVLLIDADLRRGTQREIFGLPEGQSGFSEILKQQIGWRDAVRPTRYEGLSIITSGKSYHEGAELFLSPSLGVLSHEAKLAYDYIIFDSAPLLATDDTAALAPKVDGVLFAMRANFTSSRAAYNCLEQLHRRQVRVLGIVINRLRYSGSAYGYHDYNKYKSYYQKSSSSTVSKS